MSAKPKLDLTAVKARVLDIKRGLFQPADATLHLLDHQPASGRGYTKVVTVTQGWRFEGRTGQPGTLYIAESDNVTLKLLQKARAFLLSGMVYILQDENSVTKPKSDSQLVWEFKVTPTGEPLNI